VNKKIYVIMIAIIIFSTQITGCLENKVENKNKEENVNDVPVAVLKAPEIAYFDEKIVFDATESYDLDGSIIEYSWDFGDGNTTKGEKVEHIYKLGNSYDSYFPIIYTILLYVTDDHENIKATNFMIKLFPKKYTFYMSSGSLTTNKPLLKEGKFDVSGLQKIKIFSLENNVTIQKCKWRATIYLEKALILRATKLSINLFDSEKNEISYKEKDLGLNTLWTKKTVLIDGTIDKNINFKSIIITISGFSIRNKINILYGGEKASNICFDFTN